MARIGSDRLEGVGFTDRGRLKVPCNAMREPSDHSTETEGAKERGVVPLSRSRHQRTDEGDKDHENRE